MRWHLLSTSKFILNIVIPVSKVSVYPLCFLFLICFFFFFFGVGLGVGRVVAQSNWNESGDAQSLICHKHNMDRGMCLFNKSGTFSVGILFIKSFKRSLYIDFK